jgi:hypothetical protein
MKFSYIVFSDMQLVVDLVIVCGSNRKTTRLRYVAALEGINPCHVCSSAPAFPSPSAFLATLATLSVS